MSLKAYCDVCGSEVTNNQDRVRRALGKVTVEIMIRYEHTWNAGHVCEACVLKVVNEGRPVAYNEGYLATKYPEVA